MATDPSTQTARAGGGDGWTRTEHLLAIVIDELRTANWQRTKDGAKGRNRPKPMSPLAQKPGVTYGRTDRSPEEVAAYLDRFNPHTPEEVTSG